MKTCEKCAHLNEECRNEMYGMIPKFFTDKMANRKKANKALLRAIANNCKDYKETKQCQQL